MESELAAPCRWVFLLNIVITLLLIYLSSHQLRHVAAVNHPNVPVYSKASTTDTSSHVVGTVTLGDTVEVHSLQANGWCQVTLPGTRVIGYPGIPGYIQLSFLSMSDSTKAALL
ncbi:SH3 domain-containing protein [Hymenobacter sediminis]|uniref:SH3 domain-containing protein n=1 Tax=Hymenobacter sediminis TaxID=2218621 RepID=UPI000DA66C1F|nr:SH3 domain-containing protein [Hymenobacter sediminis]